VAEKAEPVEAVTGDTEAEAVSVTNASKMKVTASKTVKAGLDKKVKFTVKVTGYKGKVTYQWQVSTDGKKWAAAKDSGAKTKTLTIKKVTEATYKNQYRCVAKDKKGKVISNVVKVQQPFTLTVSGSGKELAVGKSAKIVVKAKGTKGTVTYQWQYSTDGGATWKATKLTGAKKATFKPKVSNDVYGMLFRCEVTDKNGKLYSKTAYVEPVEGKKFTYKKNGKVWTLSGYKGTKTSVTLPAGHQGKKVTVIAAKAFKGKAFKSVVIPKSIVSIGTSAFEGCSKLTTVTLSDSVTTIGKAAFKNCKKLASMKIKNK